MARVQLHQKLLGNQEAMEAVARAYIDKVGGTSRARLLQLVSPSADARAHAASALAGSLDDLWVQDMLNHLNYSAQPMARDRFAEPLALLLKCHSHPNLKVQLTPLIGGGIGGGTNIAHLNQFIGTKDAIVQRCLALTIMFSLNSAKLQDIRMELQRLVASLSAESPKCTLLQIVNEWSTDTLQTPGLIAAVVKAAEPYLTDEERRRVIHWLAEQRW